MLKYFILCDFNICLEQLAVALVPFVIYFIWEKTLLHCLGPAEPKRPFKVAISGSRILLEGIGGRLF